MTILTEPERVLPKQKRRKGTGRGWRKRKVLQEFFNSYQIES